MPAILLTIDDCILVSLIRIEFFRFEVNLNQSNYSKAKVFTIKKLTEVIDQR